MATAKKTETETEAALLARIAELEKENSALKDELDSIPFEDDVSTPVPDDGDELVDLVLPIIGVDDRPVWVCVNGDNCAIQRGVPVRVKKKFVNALSDADKQHLEAVRMMRRAQEEGKRALAEM